MQYADGVGAYKSNNPNCPSLQEGHRNAHDEDEDEEKLVTKRQEKLDQGERRTADQSRREWDGRRDEADRRERQRRRNETSDSAIEREVQRRTTEALASAGVPEGRVTLEVLFMLPPEFVKAYRRLWDQAFLEDVKGGRVDSETGRKGNKRPGLAGERTRDAFSAGASGGGGKRFRQHWVIRDENALEAKRSVDRKLERLAREIQESLA